MNDYNFLKYLNNETYKDTNGKTHQKVNLNLVQIANVEKIKHNDFLFILDEVGCGKTLSAIMCIMNTIQEKEKQEKKAKILFLASVTQCVASIEQEFKSKMSSKFAKDVELYVLYGDNASNLDLNNVAQNKHIIIIDFANHKLADRNLDRDLFKLKYDLILLDEADVIICNNKVQNNKPRNKNNQPSRIATEMYAALLPFKAEKVIFITATPIKFNLENDLFNYAYIICSILGLGNDIKKVNEISNKIKNDIFKENGIISTIYNENSSLEDLNKALYEGCASVCFKEMAYDLDLLSISGKKSPCKRIPDIWKINPNTFNSELAGKILDILKDKKSRVVVFVDYFLEGYSLAKNLKAQGFDNYSFVMDKFYNCNSLTASQKEWYNEIGKEEKCKTPSWLHQEVCNVIPEPNSNNKLPDVLILSSKVGSSSINLPAYNYVINYSIPNNSSAMEQRFGRIDRYTSIYEELHCIYVISERNTLYYMNFVNSVKQYIEQKVINMPTKNILISESIIEKLRTDLNNMAQDNNSFKIYIKKELKNLLGILLNDNTDDKSPEEIFEQKYKLKSIMGHIKEILELNDLNSLKSNDNLLEKDNRNDIVDSIVDLIVKYNNYENISKTIDSILRNTDINKYKTSGTVIYNDKVIELTKVVSKFNVFSPNPVIKNFVSMVIETLHQKN